MEGDWTVASDPITDYLRQNGRVGVPFNMVYGPEAPHGIPLPIILSEEAVMSAIKLASGLLGSISVFAGNGISIGL
ncbi:membrane protein [Vibrio ishigakensis]|uniref:Membrane protein n=1 Tax=Vibrio ishigakensis TaxID=1481914 RepID=A0A0B8PJH9_9VIBR|nr:membrane protein [Vibrio ishigakensis]